MILITKNSGMIHETKMGYDTFDEMRNVNESQDIRYREHHPTDPRGRICKRWEK